MSRIEALLPDGVEVLTFAMGEFSAKFPTDRQYVKNHMWAASVGNDRLRFGLAAYAVRLLQDVYFIDFDVEPPAAIALRQEIGAIESKKAESGIYSPAAGELVAINPEVLRDPGVINVDPYGEGWLIEVATPRVELLTTQQYLTHLDAAWQVAQRTIKGQVNTE